MPGVEASVVETPWCKRKQVHSISIVERRFNLITSIQEPTKRFSSLLASRYRNKAWPCSESLSSPLWSLFSDSSNPGEAMAIPACVDVAVSATVHDTSSIAHPLLLPKVRRIAYPGSTCSFPVPLHPLESSIQSAPSAPFNLPDSPLLDRDPPKGHCPSSNGWARSRGRSISNSRLCQPTAPKCVARLWDCQAVASPFPRYRRPAASPASAGSPPPPRASSIACSATSERQRQFGRAVSFSCIGGSKDASKWNDASRCGDGRHLASAGTYHITCQPLRLSARQSRRAHRRR